MGFGKGLVAVFRSALAGLRKRLVRRYYPVAATDEEEAKATPDVSYETRRRALASLFPCFYNKGHKREPWTPHTCNSFLLGPADYKKREGQRFGAHMIVVSHWSAHANKRKGAA